MSGRPGTKVDVGFSLKTLRRTDGTDSDLTAPGTAQLPSSDTDDAHVAPSQRGEMAESAVYRSQQWAPMARYLAAVPDADGWVCFDAPAIPQAEQVSTAVGAAT